jgi:hypothetical protein
MPACAEQDHDEQYQEANDTFHDLYRVRTQLLAVENEFSEFLTCQRDIV